MKGYKLLDDGLINEYGYESGYASDEIELLRVISREEMINIVLSSKNRDRITRF